MGTYFTAQVCPNGHVISSAADQYPEQREAFCGKCGEATLMACQSCSSAIRGYYHVPGVIGLNPPSGPPAFCHGCGKAFPWTDRKISAAVELVEAGGSLTSEQLAEFRLDLIELTKDTPRTQVASMRFKNVMSAAGSSISSGVRDIVISVLSEAAKKYIIG